MLDSYRPNRVARSTLRDIYYAEGQILHTLPDMIEKAHDAQLKKGFETHLRETENHVKRLET